ncbi:hypothetical protein KEJ39_07760, partial [Candidatus Bathyarchaeota archaeon]|nr:hypothetical protein [Candidatus Bathyarchaeota archaeon]
MRKRLHLGILLAMLMMELAVMPQASAYPYKRNDECVADALSWLRSRQQATGMIGSFAISSWAAMAIAASEDDPGKWSQPGGTTLTQYLKNNVASLTSCLDYSRFILSMVAAGEDPQNINGIDLVSKLESYYTGGQFGDASLLNDDFWAIIALISAGRYKTDEKIQSAVNFVKTHQHASGGWSFDVAATYGLDVDSTAAAIMALISAGESATSTSITSGLGYIKSKQDESGGFNGGWGTSAETDSWAIQAILSAGQDPTGPAWRHSSGKTPVDDLLTFQNPDGGFKDWTGISSEWATSYAISALVGKPYPVIKGARTTIRIEGQSSTIWKGEVFTTWSNITEATPVAGRRHYYGQPTVIGALDEAAVTAGFTYVVDYSWGSAYVTTINGEAASGVNGWLFRVNSHTTGSWACDQYILNVVTPPDPPHTDILWYYGGWNDKVLRLSVDQTTVEVGASVTATVTYLDEGSNLWLPVGGASVCAGTIYTTDQNGQVQIQFLSGGTYQIYAEKAGYIRSDKVQVKVSGDHSDSNIEADIIPALALEVEPSSIDFGTVGPN